VGHVPQGEHPVDLIVEQIEGDAHKAHINNIRSRGQHCGQNSYYQYGIPPVPGKGTVPAHTGPAENSHEQRQFKYQPETKQKKTRKAQSAWRSADKKAK